MIYVPFRVELKESVNQLDALVELRKLSDEFTLRKSDEDCLYLRAPQGTVEQIFDCTLEYSTKTSQRPFPKSGDPNGSLTQILSEWKELTPMQIPKALDNYADKACVEPELEVIGESG